MSPPQKRTGAKWPGFLINRSGLPFDELTWNELWEFASHLHPEAKLTLREIQSAPSLIDLPHPLPPSASLARQGRTVEYVEKVQDYLKKLTYNHTGTQFFETRPNSSILTLMELARAMVREALPIKCMEAVVLAVYLTHGVSGLGRFTINFKSELPQQNKFGSSSNNNNNGFQHQKRFFYHVVLGLTSGNKFGSIGLSRRSTLMDKEMKYGSLFDLVEEFRESYSNCGQKLVKVRVGQLISHDLHSISPIPWKGVTVHPQEEDEKEVRLKIEKFSRELRSNLRVTR